MVMEVTLSKINANLTIVKARRKMIVDFVGWLMRVLYLQSHASFASIVEKFVKVPRIL